MSTSFCRSRLHSISFNAVRSHYCLMPWFDDDYYVSNFVSKRCGRRVLCAQQKWVDISEVLPRLGRVKQRSDCDLGKPSPGLKWWKFDESRNKIRWFYIDKDEICRTTSNNFQHGEENFFFWRGKITPIQPISFFCRFLLSLLLISLPTIARAERRSRLLLFIGTMNSQVK